MLFLDDKTDVISTGASIIAIATWKGAALLPVYSVCKLTNCICFQWNKEVNKMSEELLSKSVGSLLGTAVIAVVSYVLGHVSAGKSRSSLTDKWVMVWLWWDLLIHILLVSHRGIAHKKS